MTEHKCVKSPTFLACIMPVLDHGRNMTMTKTIDQKVAAYRNSLILGLAETHPILSTLPPQASTPSGLVLEGDNDPT